MERIKVQTGSAKQAHSGLLARRANQQNPVVARPATYIRVGGGAEPNLVKRKSVWHPPVFDEFSICKSTDGP
jgi:hypothetical protein